jgi:hypothetical protein
MTAHQSNAIDLCVLSDVKDYIFRGGGNQTQTDDNLLQRMITALSESIDKDLGRTIKAANYNETRSGEGTKLMFVLNPPIISVTSVYVDGVSIPAKSTDPTQTITSNGYFASEKYISLFGYSFSRGLDNVQLNYRGGYNSAPPDLEQACIEAVGWAYKELDRLGQVSKSLAGEIVQFNVDAMSKRARTVVEHLKRVAIT